MNRSKHIAGLLSVLVLAAATTGAPAQKSNRPGPSALSETYDTWTVQCANRTEGETTTQVCQMSQQLLQQEKPRQARLAFERAVQFLRRQADQERYRLQLRDLAKYLERANNLALEREPTEDDHDELTAGLTQEEIDDPWRKKQVYD